MLLLYLPALLVVASIGLYAYFTRTFNYWKKRNVVGPEPIALFGNIKDFTLRRKNASLVLQDIYNSYPEESIVGIYRMTTPCLLVRDLDMIKQIMIKDFDWFSDRGMDVPENVLRQNMFHADINTWGALRPTFSPSFTSLKLKGMFHLLNECTDNMTGFLNKTCLNNAKCDISSLAKQYTLSSISACAFGVNLNNFNDKVDDTLQKLDKMIFTPTYAVELDIMYPGILKKLDYSFGLGSARKFFADLVNNVMSQRNHKSTSRGDFMDLILQIREVGEIKNSKVKEGVETVKTKVTDEVIAAQAFLFYVAGYETSSTTIGYMLHQLALHPEIQSKLREEIDSITNAHGLVRGQITYESLKDMKYLDKAFLETLRMYPVVDPLQRRAVADYKLPGTDVVIKKDQILLVSAYSIHHDKKYYPKPEVFDPERFEPEVAGSRHPCAYLPFGVGPRNCIGMRFGSLQTRLCIAKLISRFQIEVTEDTNTSINISPNRVLIGPAENIYLNVRPRVL